MTRASTFLQRSPLLLLAALLVALAVFVAGNTPPASAQPAAYVSNLGQTSGIVNFDLSTASDALAQQFTTGSETGGYELGSIDVKIRNAPTTAAQRDTIRAELWSAVASGGNAGEPNAKLATLTVPAHPISAGTVNFAAPANTTLEASTSYNVVIYTTGDLNLGLVRTGATDEDSGGATGWSVRDRSYSPAAGNDFNTPSGITDWSSATGATFAMQIGVNPPDADPLAPVSLVTNASETAATTNAALSNSRTVAQAFTTGSNSDDYVLTGVEVQVASDLSQSARNGLKAQIWTNSNSNTPGVELINLLVPAHPIEAGTVNFTAPAGGVDSPQGAGLSANTTYWLVIWGNPIDNALKTTASDSETGDYGFAIANTFRYADANPPTGSSTWETPSGGRSLLLTVKGREIAEKNYRFTPSGFNLRHGLGNSMRIILSEATPEEGLELTVTPLLGGDVPAGMCAGQPLADAADIPADAPTSVTVEKNQTSWTLEYPPADNGDDFVGGDGECFAVQLGTSVAGWGPGPFRRPRSDSN